METLFRFVLTRPAIAQRESTPSIKLAQPTNFQAALGPAHESRASRTAVKGVATLFVQSPAFVSDPGNLPMAAALRQLETALSALDPMVDLTNANLIATIEGAFGTSIDALREGDDIPTAIASLKDSILAIKLLPEEHLRPIEALSNQLRLLELVEKTATDPSFPTTNEDVKWYRRRSLELPRDADLRSALSVVEKRQELQNARTAELEAQRAESKVKLERFKRVSAAIRELSSLDANFLNVTEQTPSDGFTLPDHLQPMHIFDLEMQQRQRHLVRTLNLDEVVVRDDPVVEATVLPLLRTPLALSDTLVSSLSTQAPILKNFLHSGLPPFVPASMKETAFLVRSDMVDTVSAETRDLLTEHQIVLDQRPLDEVVGVLTGEKTRLSRQLEQSLVTPHKVGFKLVGNALISIEEPILPVMADWTMELVDTSLDFFFPADFRVPQSHGNVTPAGIADLLVVKQQLIGFEGADVAHIENVLRGEKKEREHVRRRETEELTFTEVETTTSEERELESTNRFELSRETSATIKEDASLKAGLTLSGKYGPFVEFSASVEGSMSRSKEESTKSAATFSQDVTERSAHKVTERVLERSSLRVTNEVVETNRHTLDNVGGAGNIAGVYQWVNKVYQAQMFNYGLRTLYDFMIPEPGAFLIDTMVAANARAVTLSKPPAFTIQPNQINETNVHQWIRTYRATDVAPPPEMYKTKSATYAAGNGDSNTDYFHAEQIAIDDGYYAIWGNVRTGFNIWDPNCGVYVILGTAGHEFRNNESWAFSTTLGQERDSIPFAVKTWRASDVVVTAEVKCVRSERAMEKWRLETHAKLMNAYQARLQEYEEKLAALEMQAGIAIQGQNPAANLELMNDEIKKNCISILTEQHFDLFDAVDPGSSGFSEINLYENAAEGPYVRFFEQAFEWEQMTWITYPYFWGRKSQWTNRIAYEDTDPLFNQFLKAGYCRVVVPARLGFEGAIDHFMNTGDIWVGGPLPTISNPLYLPIADEIAERLDRPGEEIPQGDPWLVRIPTTLVHLRSDDKLPKWQQNATGEWVEV